MFSACHAVDERCGGVGRFRCGNQGVRPAKHTAGAVTVQHMFRRRAPALSRAMRNLSVYVVVPCCSMLFHVVPCPTCQRHSAASFSSFCQVCWHDSWIIISGIYYQPPTTSYNLWYSGNKFRVWVGVVTAASFVNRAKILALFLLESQFCWWFSLCKGFSTLLFCLYHYLKSCFWANNIIYPNWLFDIVSIAFL